MQDKQTKPSISLSQALRYPFSGKDWFSRILLLTLVQFIPIIGQFILLGYGLEVVRSIYAGHLNLPAIYWGRALGDGTRLLMAGLLYVSPLFAVAPMILTIGTTEVDASPGDESINGVGVLLSILGALIILPILRQFSKRSSTARLLTTGLIGVVTIVLALSAISTMRALLADISTGSRSLNEIGTFLFIILSVVIFLIGVGLSVGGVRYAIENKGLFDPPGNAKFLLKNRAVTGILILNIILLHAITILAIGLGLVLLIVPGALAFVVCSLAVWYLYASYGMTVGIGKADVSAEKTLLTVQYVNTT